MLQKLERALGRYAIHNLTFYLVGGQALFFALAYTRPEIVDHMRLIRELAFAQPWRFFTFIFIPPTTNVMFVLFALYFTHMMGSALENAWGAFRYNVYVFVACLMTIVSSLLIPGGETTNEYILGSIFLAFATMNPDFQMYVFFLIPVRAKWLAFITVLGYGYTLAVGPWSARAAVIASIANFLLFFGRSLVRDGLSSHKYMRRQIQQVRERREESERVYHRCVTCGITDRDDPKMQFRYATDRNGTQCYCINHLRKRA